MEHQVWFTAILNKLLGGVVTPLLAKIGQAPSDPAYPIPNYVAMEVFVILLMIVGVVILRRSLSVENPGKFQHLMEVVVQFIQGMCEEIIGHGSGRYVAMLGSLGIFVMLCNLLGLIPTMQTPTGHIQVTLGCAVAAFLYYNFQGVRQHGAVGYLMHLAGPLLAAAAKGQGRSAIRHLMNLAGPLLMAVIMFPVEVFGNLGRLLSLSVRLYANMMVGDQLESVFGGLIPILVPAVFMALHVFVSVLQAYIFMLLPAVYIGMAVSEEH
ncbi:MAG: FoF1 ATP synthase subunit a [Terriglobia bacterium]|jgi:F-type H+-transporting ATPase subunit a